MWARKAQNLFSLVSFLRFPSQKRTVLVRKPYVFGSKTVRFWDGNHKSKPFETSLLSKLEINMLPVRCVPHLGLRALQVNPLVSALHFEIAFLQGPLPVIVDIVTVLVSPGLREIFSKLRRRMLSGVLLATRSFE